MKWISQGGGKKSSSNFSFVRLATIQTSGSHSEDKQAKVAEWLTHWIANPAPSGVAGSSPVLGALNLFLDFARFSIADIKFVENFDYSFSLFIPADSFPVKNSIVNIFLSFFQNFFYHFFS